MGVAESQTWTRGPGGPEGPGAASWGCPRGVRPSEPLGQGGLFSHCPLLFFRHKYRKTECLRNSDLPPRSMKTGHRRLPLLTPTLETISRENPQPLSGSGALEGRCPASPGMCHSWTPSSGALCIRETQPQGMGWGCV